MDLGLKNRPGFHYLLAKALLHSTGPALQNFRSTPATAQAAFSSEKADSCGFPPVANRTLVTFPSGGTYSGGAYPVVW